MSLCHCIECQRRTGSPFGVGAYYEADKVSFAGPSSVYTRHVEERWLRFHFCPGCGSTVYWQAQGHNGRWGIAVGAFSDPDFPKPQRSVFERSRHDWLGIDNDIPGFIAGKDSRPSR